MIRNNIVKELCRKVWEDGYENNCDGIHQCKEDLEYVENYIDDLERKNILKDELINEALKFINGLFPKYIEEKHHIIMGDDWELNRSIYVMSEIRDRLTGYVRGGEKNGNS